MLNHRAALRVTLADEAYNSLKRMIINGDLPPGAEFTEVQAAEFLATGRTPVREALARLRNRRLIIVAPPRRYAVAPITVSDVRDLFEVRRLLETEATKLAAGRADGDDLRRLDAACSAAYQPQDPDSVSGFLRANTEFHLTVAKASGNRRLVELLAPILDEMERLLHLGLRGSDRSEEIIHEHRRLIGALEAGDPAGAAHEVVSQLHDAQAMVMRAFIGGALDSEVSARAVG